jgi:hypothetical protein
MNAFKLRRFHALVILQCVRWYGKSKLTEFVKICYIVFDIGFDTLTQRLSGRVYEKQSSIRTLPSEPTVVLLASRCRIR